jgi:outer membrane protein assembly factor BamB
VYAVGPTGFLYCLNADNGALLWQHQLLTEFNGRPLRYGVSFSPLVEADLVITTPGGPEGNAVVAFNKHTGSVVWNALDDPMGYSSPMAVTLAGVRQLLIFTNTALVSLSPLDGQIYWRYPWETPGGFNIATPIPFGDCVFISSGYGKGCALLEVTREPDGSVAAHRVYEHNRMRNHFASSVRCGDYLYGFDQTDLACMELCTGKVVWREKGFRTFGKGSLLIADGQLIVLGESGKLYLVEATPAGYYEKASFQVSSNKCWTAPIAAHGKLYVRTESQIICLDLQNDRSRD